MATGAENLPALKYMQEPVGVLNDLYIRHPKGGEYGWFAFVYREAQLAYWDIETKRWEWVKAVGTVQMTSDQIAEKLDLFQEESNFAVKSFATTDGKKVPAILFESRNKSNLIPDCEFVNGKGSWNLNYDVNNKETEPSYEIVSEVLPDGVLNAIKVTTNAAGQGLWIPDVWTESGKTYTFSFWAKGTEGIAMIYGYEEIKGETVILGLNWKKYSMEITAGSNRKSLLLYPSSSCVYYIANPMLTVGKQENAENLSRLLEEEISSINNSRVPYSTTEAYGDLIAIANNVDIPEGEINYRHGQLVSRYSYSNATPPVKDGIYQFVFCSSGLMVRRIDLSDPQTFPDFVGFAKSTQLSDMYERLMTVISAQSSNVYESLMTVISAHSSNVYESLIAEISKIRGDNSLNFQLLSASGTASENDLAFRTAYAYAKTLRSRYLGSFSEDNDSIIGYSFSVGDIVEMYDVGNYYRCISNVTCSSYPNVDATHWVLVENYDPSIYLSPTHRYTLVLLPGTHLNADFTADEKYVDIVSLSGNRDVNVRNFSITADDVYVHGLNCGSYTLSVAGSLSLTKIVNCIATGQNSFGNNGAVCTSTFVDCESGYYSFSPNGTCAGTYIRCKGTSCCFAYKGNCSGMFTDCEVKDHGFASSEYVAGVTDYTNTCSGTFRRCIAGDRSFGYQGKITTTAVFYSCVSGNGGFAGSIALNVINTNVCAGTFYNCISQSKSFGAGGICSGKFYNCSGRVASFGGNNENTFGGTFSGYAINCTGDWYSFGRVALTGTLIHCKIENLVGAGDSTFIAVSDAGKTRYCIDSYNNTNNQG